MTTPATPRFDPPRGSAAPSSDHPANGRPVARGLRGCLAAGLAAGVTAGVASSLAGCSAGLGGARPDLSGGPGYGAPALDTIDERSAARRRELAAKYGDGSAPTDGIDPATGGIELPPIPTGDVRSLSPRDQASVLMNDLALSHAGVEAMTRPTGTTVAEPTRGGPASDLDRLSAPSLDSRADRARRSAEQNGGRTDDAGRAGDSSIRFNADSGPGFANAFGDDRNASDAAPPAGTAATTADYINGRARLPERAARPEGGWRNAPFGRPEDQLATDPVAPPIPDAAAASLVVDPAITALAGYRRTLLDRVIDGADGPLDELVAMTFTLTADPDARIDPEYYRGLTEEQREMVDAFEAFAREAAPALAGDADPEALVEITERLRDRLARTPMLALRNPAMCTAVEGFGTIERIEHTAFPAGVETPVLIYAEVDEFTSALDEGGEWVTDLEMRTRIYSDRETRPVWEGDWHRVLDRSRTQRRDFFITQELWIPEALSLGRYHVKLELRDRASGAVDEHALPFDVVVGRSAGRSAGR